MTGLGVVQPEQAAPLVDDAEYKAGCDHIAVDRGMPMRGLESIKPVYLKGSELIDCLDFAVGQGLMDDPMDRAPVRVAEFVRCFLVGGSTEY